MAAKDYSFEPVGATEPSYTPVVEAVPSSATPDSYYNEEAERPSDTAIMLGCGLVGWVVAGPFLAILTALGGKYAADRSQGPIGDASRAVGRIASAAGKKAKEERLLCKFKAAIRSLFAKKDCQCKSCQCKSCNCGN
mmetsp:Transcript_15677/g.33950  ORF Transcript_15677/g.33950 Transcript_15677/m.33950 type:complete len:137 (-) Transcript_15677:218-628(-)|eukprot:CAMPEP_0172313084 /NCGR_PEP_ID=MMETSP1058-20130122/19335_1 /TAXON_ID=83371 /ORGANISM="Detonula confervacea, Strain CCMP 353" /LENGTH=136 /DNA_ID=CAMNT_0013026679 /DNA_START=125 /DNA_END=535 /DNA_ORIENTATION=+